MALASCHLVSLQPVCVPGRPVVEVLPKAELKCYSSATVFPICASPTSLERADRKATVTTMMMMMSVATEGKLGGRKGGAGVLERPGLDQSTPDTAPRTEEGGEMGKSRQTVRFGSGDRYRVLLLDHERHTESQVAKVIPRVVPSVTPDEARKCFFESREFGFGLVTIAVKEHAEFYVQMLTRYGLRSSMEHDSGVA